MNTERELYFDLYRTSGQHSLMSEERVLANHGGLTGDYDSKTTRDGGATPFSISEKTSSLKSKVLCNGTGMIMKDGHTHVVNESSKHVYTENLLYKTAPGL